MSGLRLLPAVRPAACADAPSDAADVMQGVPMGFAFGSLPYLLQEARASYGAIAWFSVASYPFSMKLIWAPVIDAVYSARFGRRKSWIVPMQLLIGLTLLYMSVK